MKKSIVVLICMLILLCGSVYAADFSDLPTEHWAYKNVMKMVNRGIISGYPNGTFNPNGTITKAEFFKLLGVASEGEKFFELLDYGGAWYFPYLFWVNKNGLSIDYFDSSQINENITRLEMAVMLSNTVNMKQINNIYIEDFDKYEGVTTVEYSNFSDINELSEIYQNSILSIADMKLINGYEDGTFRPNNYMTRAEAAIVIARFLQAKNGGEEI